MNTATVTDPNGAHSRQSTQPLAHGHSNPNLTASSPWRDMIQDAVAAFAVSSVIIVLAYLYWNA